MTGSLTPASSKEDVQSGQIFTGCSGFYHAFILILLLGVAFPSCKKPVLEETALLPDERLDLKFTDTLTVRAHTVREEFVDMKSTTLCVLGFMDDPDFGKTQAGFYLPFVLGRNNLTLDDTIVTFDSIVLYLRYYSEYGDWTIAQSVKVYEMTEGIDDSVDYYSNQTFAINSSPVGESLNFIPNLTDSVEIDSVSYPPLLRIKLDDSFGQKFVDASGSSDYADEASFREFFKGLYLEAGDVGNGLVNFDPYLLGGAAISRLTVYYHDAEDSAKSYSFRANPIAFVNHFDHDYSGSTAEAFINNPNTSIGDSLIFLQALAGMNVKFIAPNIGNLGKILINRAELVITKIDRDNDTTYSAPSKLTLYEADADGTFNAKKQTPDQSFTNTFGGDLKTETDSTGTHTRYRFTLSRYYQDILEGDPDFGIFILPDRRYHLPGQLLAGGGNHSTHALKLNLTYTLIEE